jgi:hypothetical protein
MPDEKPSGGIPTEPADEIRPSEAVNPPTPPNNPPAQATQPIGAQEHDSEISDLKDEVRTAEKYMLWLTGAIAFFALCTIGVGLLQWNVMSGQLGEMKSGGVDTHNLADAAKKQADKAETLATETHTLAVAANTSANAAKDANNIARIASRSVQRAFIVVDHLDISAVRFPSGQVERWIVNPVVTNSGNTPTVNLYYQIGFGAPTDMTRWPSDKEPPFDNSMFPSLIEVRKHEKGGWVRGVVGAHSAVSNFTVLNGFMGSSLHGPGTWQNTGQYAWGSFVYGDVFDNRPKHVTEFCFVMYRTTMVNDQFAPYGRCNHHNCTDEECDADENRLPN